MPSGVFVARLSQVRIALQTIPASMTGNGGYLRDRLSHFKESGNPLVAQIMKSKIRYFQMPASSGEGRAYRVR